MGRRAGRKASSGAAPKGTAEADLKQRVRDRRRHGKGLAWGHVTRFVFKLTLRHPLAVAVTLLLTLLLVGIEVMAVALIFPFLDLLMGEGGGRLANTALGFLVPFFDGMPAATRLRWFASVTVVLALAKALLLYGTTRVAQYLHIVIDRDLRLMLFDDLMSVELRWINKQRSSNLFTLVHSFPTSAAKIMDQYMMGFQNFTSFVAIAIMAALTSWKLAGLAGVLGIVVALIAVQLTRLVRALAIDIKESRLELHSTTLEALNAMKVLHLFGRIPFTKQRYRQRLKTFQDNQYAKARISSVIGPFQSLLSALFVASILFGATLLVNVADPYYLGTLAAFMYIINKFQSRTSKYAKRRAEIAAEVPAMEEVLHHLSRKDKTRLVDGRRPLPAFRQAVRFEDVRFRYDAGDPEVIKGVSFEIPKGQMVALVGASGAGKSTIIDLLARLYDPDSGRIVVDGHDLREYRTQDWRSRIAVVSQDSFLFNDTLRENIRFGRLEASDAEVEDAARQANAHGFISEMPLGYETEIGDRGVRLSGGQAQRIAIARAILADPDILILDEATSALDAATEAEVQKAIERVSADRTIVAIAHRLSTVRRADQIVVLEGGQVVESGRHDELLAAKGRYWENVQLQDLGREERQGVAPHLPHDDRVAWIEVTADGDTGAATADVARLAGVKAARARGDRMDVFAAAPSRTIPDLVRTFAAHGLDVVSLRLDEVSGGDGPVYRWSGNGAGLGAHEAVWLEFYVSGDADRIADAFLQHRFVHSAFVMDGAVSIVLREPGRTVPELLRAAAGRGVQVLAIDPREMDPVDRLPDAF